MNLARRIGPLGFLLSFTAHAGFIGYTGFFSNTSFSNGRNGVHEIEVSEFSYSSGTPQTHQHPKTKAQRVAKRDDISLSTEKAEASAEVSTIASSSATTEKTEGATGPVGGHTYGEEEVDEPAKLLSQPKLLYPKRAFREGLEGSVVLYLVVDANGAVKHSEVTRGAGNGFDEAALIAARDLHFASARKDGQPVSVHVHWTCHFKIDD